MQFMRQNAWDNDFLKKKNLNQSCLLFTVSFQCLITFHEEDYYYNKIEMIISHRQIILPQCYISF